MTHSAGLDPPSTIIKQTSNKGEKVTCTDGKIRTIAKKIPNSTTNETTFKFKHRKGNNKPFAKMWHCVRDRVSPYSAYQEVLVLPEAPLSPKAPLRFRGIEYQKEVEPTENVITLSPLGSTGKPLQINFNKAEFYKYGNCVVVCKGEPSYQTFTIGSETLDSIKPKSFALSYKAEETDNISRSAALKKALPEIYKQHDIANFSIFDFETKEEGQKLLDSFLPETEDKETCWPRRQHPKFVSRQADRSEFKLNPQSSPSTTKTLLSEKLQTLGDICKPNTTLMEATAYYHPKGGPVTNETLYMHQDSEKIENLMFICTERPDTNDAFLSAVFPVNTPGLIDISDPKDRIKYYLYNNRRQAPQEKTFVLEEGDCLYFSNRTNVHTLQNCRGDALKEKGRGIIIVDFN